MFVFFTNVKMLTISDPDDWTYISKIRIPIPSLNEYNPAKVLPETIMGLLGYFAAYVEKIEGDYNNVVGLPVGRLYQEGKDWLNQ